MKQNNLENIIKDRLYHAEEQAPDVLNSIFQKRSSWYILRNRMYLNRYKWLSASALFIAILSILWWTNRPASNSVEVGQNTSDSAITSSTEKNYTSNIDNINKSNTPLVEENKPATNFEIGKTGNNPVTNPSSGSSNPRRKNSDQGTRPVPNPSNNDIVVQGGESGHGGDMNNDRNNRVGRDLAKADLNQPKGELVDNEPGTQQNSGNPQKDETIENQKDKTPTPSPKISKNIESNDTDKSKDLASDEDDVTKNPLDEPLPKTSPIGKWSITAAFGPSLGSRNLSGNNPAWIDLRNQTESPLISNQAYVLFNREIGNNLEVYAGAGVLTRKEKVKYTETYSNTEMNVTSKQVVKYDPVLPPRSATLYDTTYTTINGSEEHSWENTYRYVTIPVGLRYTHYLGSKWGVYGSADAMFVIASEFKGSLLNHDMSEQSISGNQFKRAQTGMAIGLALGTSYAIDPKLTALIEPRGTFFQTPATSNRYGIKQKDVAGSILIGLKYHF